MRINVVFIACVLFLMTANAGLYAQTASAIDSAAGRFSKELAGMKESSDRLSIGNEQLSAKNNELRITLSQYQGRLQKSLDESNSLTRETLKLQDVNAAKAAKISDLEKALFDVNAQIEHVQDDMKHDIGLLDHAKEEDARLTRQIINLGGSAVALPVREASVTTDFTKEKLRMLKMIDESKRRQEIIVQQLADSKRNKVVSVVTIEGAHDKDQMVAKMKRLQEEIDQLEKMRAAPMPQPEMWDEKELRQLDQQVNVLQRNHDELQQLVAKMQEKAQHGVLSKDDMKEQRRLQASLDDVNKENRQLKQDLNDLRLKMVELDKRKSYLDNIVGKKR